LVEKDPPFLDQTPEFETNDVLFEIDFEARIVFATHLYSDQQPEWIYFDDFIKKIKEITSQ